MCLSLFIGKHWSPKVTAIPVVENEEYYVSWYLFGQHNSCYTSGTSFSTGIPHAWHSYINTLLEEQYSCFLNCPLLWDYSFTILSPFLVKSLPVISYYPNSQVHFSLYYQFYQFCNSSHTSSIQFCHLTLLVFIEVQVPLEWWCSHSASSIILRVTCFTHYKVVVPRGFCNFIVTSSLP